jgi:hypothetical protein
VKDTNTFSKPREKDRKKRRRKRVHLIICNWTQNYENYIKILAVPSLISKHTVYLMAALKRRESETGMS